jgi:hypothetical protein
VGEAAKEKAAPEGAASNLIFREEMPTRSASVRPSDTAEVFGPEREPRAEA